MIRVFVCTNSVTKLTRLEAVVRSAPSLELVGGILGRAGLSQRVPDIRADVLLECSVLEHMEGSQLPGFDSKSIARILLVNEPDFPLAVTAIQLLDSRLRGILPKWASAREIEAAIKAAANGLLVPP